MPQSYTIARLAEAAGVHVETVRYYQRRKLVPVPTPPLGSIRRYQKADLEQLRFIKRAQVIGFTLNEIEGLMALRTSRSCRATRELAAAKLSVVERKIRELRKLHQELAALIANCDANPEDSTCPVIDRLVLHP